MLFVHLLLQISLLDHVCIMNNLIVSVILRSLIHILSQVHIVTVLDDISGIIVYLLSLGWYNLRLKKIYHIYINGGSWVIFLNKYGFGRVHFQILWTVILIQFCTWIRSRLYSTLRAFPSLNRFIFLVDYGFNSELIQLVWRSIILQFIGRIISESFIATGIIVIITLIILVSIKVWLLFIWLTNVYIFNWIFWSCIVMDLLRIIVICCFGQKEYSFIGRII